MERREFYKGKMQQSRRDSTEKNLVFFRMKASKFSHFSVAKNLTSGGFFLVLKSVEMCDMTAGNF